MAGAYAIGHLDLAGGWRHTMASRLHWLSGGGIFEFGPAGSLPVIFLLDFPFPRSAVAFMKLWATSIGDSFSPRALRLRPARTTYSRPPAVSRLMRPSVRASPGGRFPQWWGWWPAKTKRFTPVRSASGIPPELPCKSTAYFN